MISLVLRVFVGFSTKTPWWIIGQIFGALSGRNATDSTHDQSILTLKLLQEYMSCSSGPL